MSSLPPAFRDEIHERWLDSEMDNATATYYLDTFTLADSTSVPGQNGRPSEFGDALKDEDARMPTTSYTTMSTGQGWHASNKIGDGTYGSIILWVYPRANGPPLRAAIKDAACSSFFRDYCAEASLTRRLNETGCKNVIRVLEWAFVPANDFRQTYPRHRIAYEFAEHLDLGSLYQWYQSQGLIFPEPFIWHVLCSIATALQFCRHGHASLPGRQGWDAVVHGDIKCENILLTAVDQDRQPEDYPPIKLADFRLAHTLGASVTSVQRFVTRQARGTIGYVAPEMGQRTPEEDRRRRPHELHGPHSDIYALGMTCKKLLKLVEFSPSGTAPGSSLDLTQVYSPELRNLLDQCVAPDSRDRPKTHGLFTYAAATMHRMLQAGFESSKDAEGRLRPYHSLVLFTSYGRQRWNNDPQFRQAHLDGNCFSLRRMVREEAARRNGA